MSDTTIVIQIGNSDDKLTQARWALFCLNTEQVLARHGQLHFAGYSLPTQLWQNACFVVELRNYGTLAVLGDQLRDLASEYGQDSIAMTAGTTKFVTPVKTRPGTNQLTPDQIEQQAGWLYRNDAEFHAEVYGAAMLLDTKPWKIAHVVRAVDLIRKGQEEWARGQVGPHGS